MDLWFRRTFAIQSGAFAIAVALVFVFLGEILHADRWQQILLASCGFLITWFGAAVSCFPAMHRSASALTFVS